MLRASLRLFVTPKRFENTKKISKIIPKPVLVDNTIMEGTVAKFFADRNYGFIIPTLEDDLDPDWIFAHGTFYFLQFYHIYFFFATVFFFAYNFFNNNVYFV